MIKLPFFDRLSELRKIEQALDGVQPSLVVVYGRRRCGKSRLLQELSGEKTIYFLADQSDQALQREELAKAIGLKIPGFADARYASWNALFDSLNARNARIHDKPYTLILDEFPYCVAENPSLPSIIQKAIDTGTLQVHLLICGSSQRMMQGMVLDASAPLYGRACEIIKLRPLPAGWIVDAFKTHGQNAFEHFALWGGIPRYWELAAGYADQNAAIKELVLHRDGIIHNEPRRLLLDDMRTGTQSHSILSIIGSGVHRISEIAARLGKPAMNLHTPLEMLMDLGLVKKEICFGEPERNSKRTTYSIADPFLRFWYRFVFPNLSVLEQELYDQVISVWERDKQHHFGGVWEASARESVPRLAIGGKQWKLAQRFWGNGTDGTPMELDIVSESTDGSAILLGEAKWGTGASAADINSIQERLRSCAAQLKSAQGKEVVVACWIAGARNGGIERGVINAGMVMEVLR